MNQRKNGSSGRWRALAALMLVLLALPGATPLAEPAHGPRSGARSEMLAALELVPDLVSPARSWSPTAPATLPSVGTTIVLHVRHDGGIGAVVRIEDVGGQEVLNLYAHGSTLYASDGYLNASAGTLNPHVAVGAVSSVWERIDIRLDGATYMVSTDLDPPYIGRTFTSATAGTAVAGSGSGVPSAATSADVQRIRHYPATAVLEAVRVALGTPWSLVAPSGGVAVAGSASGELGYGRLEVSTPGDLSTLAYAATPLAPFGAAYVAEASFSPLTVSTLAQGMPDHQAVLAGVDGTTLDPDVQWAVVASKVDADHRQWALFFLDGAGTRTQVSPAWTALDPLWHTVRVHVDGTAGDVSVQIDDGASVALFAAAAPVPSDRLAIGDIWNEDDPLWWTGGGTGYYDNLAVRAA